MIFSKRILEMELKKINKIFFSNNCPEIVILNIIKYKISKFKNNKTFGPTKFSVYIKIPWLSQNFIKKSHWQWFRAFIIL